MKEELIFKIFEKIESSKNLKRKLKLIVVFGIVCFSMISALTVWIGFKAFNYVSGKTKEAAQAPIVKDYAHKISPELKKISKNQAANCWGKAQSLITVQVWIEKPAIDNLIDLKTACLDNYDSPAQNLNFPKNQ